VSAPGDGSDPSAAAREDAPAPRTVVFGVALIAFATLLFEVLLTRIFSVTLWYHFGFLAISLALLGTAAAAVLCFVFPERLAGASHRGALALCATLFGLAAPAAVAFHTRVQLPGFESPGAFYAIFGSQLVALFLAFFGSGLAIAIALFRWASHVGTVYSFDLLGAGLGSLLVVPLLYRASPLALVFAVSAAAFAAAGLFLAGSSRRGRPLAAGAAALIALGLTGANDRAGLLAIGSVKDFSRKRLQRPEQDVLLELWSPMSRVAVLAPPRGTAASAGGYWITNDAAARLALRRFDGDFDALADLRADPVHAAHHLRPGANTLVIGAGGGADVLAALAFGQPRVTAVEINPAIGAIVTDHYADFIGRIFDDPRVTLHIQEGRNFVAGSPERYDVIQFTMIDSWGGAAAAGAYVFSENSLYTLEAIEDYVEHLAPGGLLSITRYYDWDEGLRLTNLFAAGLERLGHRDADQRIAVLKKTRGSARPVVTALLKNGTFTPEESRALRGLARETGAELLYAPHLPAQALASRGIDRYFRAVVAPGETGRTRSALLAGFRRDLSAPTDDRPFFFFTRRARDLLRADPTEHAARRLAMPLLYGMTATFAGIGLLTIFAPLYLRSREAIRRAPHRRSCLLYFALLGSGFMLVEISLIQRLTVFLGHPTWSFVVVLATLLFATGLGSLFSTRWPGPRPDVLAAVLAAVAALVAVYALFLYDQFVAWMVLDRTVRILLAAGVMTPAGFLMGMCFPMGVQIARRFHAALVPWGWGVNGAFSVFASILAIAVAIHAGFRATLLAGGACYALAVALVLGWRGSSARGLLRVSELRVGGGGLEPGGDVGSEGATALGQDGADAAERIESGEALGAEAVRLPRAGEPALDLHPLGAGEDPSTRPVRFGDLQVQVRPPVDEFRTRGALGDGGRDRRL